MKSLKEILSDIGYFPILETAKELRMRPIYRESDNNTSLCVFKDTGRWVDFGSSESGNFNQLIAKTLDLFSGEALIYANNFSFEVGSKSVFEYSPKIFAINDCGIMNINENLTYWNKRGISCDTLEQFRSGVCKSGKMINRHIFPIYNERMSIIGFSGRDITNNDKRPKWKHLGNKSFWVYPLFLNEKEIRAKKSVILVESIGDCLALFEVGIKNVIVLFGIKVNKSILSKIVSLDPDKIYVSLNNDKDNNLIGNKASVKLKSTLEKYFDEEQVIIKLPKNKDFNDDLLKDKKSLATHFNE